MTHDHLPMFNNIVCGLPRNDVKTEDEDKALILLSSMSSSYEHLLTTSLYGKGSIKMGL